MRSYLAVLRQQPALAQHVLGNMHLTARRFQAALRAGEAPKVAVSSWSLGHNPAGRAYLLAQLHGGVAPVDLIGTLVPRHGRELWSPLRSAEISVRSFVLDGLEDFPVEALQFVAENPYHLVHLSKPRMPNVVLGLLYKLLWQAQVVMDIDDDEMAFFPNYKGGEHADGSSLPKNLPVSSNLVGPEWTRLAVGCSAIFDAVTVSNPVLRDRFGGTIVRHARAEAEFNPERYPQAAVRRHYHIGETECVVLFLGSPRAHKGLLETAAALDALDRSDVIFLVVGSFPRGQDGLRDQLEAFPRLRCRFLPDQPFARVPELVALSDICLALQDPNSPVTVSQVPAKLSDALAMGRLAVVSDNPALRDLPLADHVVMTSWDDLGEVLTRALAGLPESEEKKQARRTLFLQEFSVAANRRRLQAVLAGLPREPKPALFEFMERVLMCMPGFPPRLRRLTEHWR